MTYCLFVKTKARHYLQHTTWLGTAGVCVAAAVSLCRVLALYQVTWQIKDLVPLSIDSQCIVGVAYIHAISISGDHH